MFHGGGLCVRGLGVEQCPPVLPERDQGGQINALCRAASVRRRPHQYVVSSVGAPAFLLALVLFDDKDKADDTVTGVFPICSPVDCVTVFEVVAIVNFVPLCCCLNVCRIALLRFLGTTPQRRGGDLARP